MRINGLFTVLALTFAAGTSAAMAEAPSCPGGGVAKGTMHCSGPVLHPICSEGPPWTCTITGNSGTNVMSSGGVSGGSKPKANHNAIIGKGNLLSH